jgi:hypothetical protein
MWDMLNYHGFGLYDAGMENSSLGISRLFFVKLLCGDANNNVY